MRRNRLAVMYLALVLAASAAFPTPPKAAPKTARSKPAAAARGRFQLAVLGAGAKPLLVIDEHDVEAYDWAAQRIVLRSDVTPRFLPVLQKLMPSDERLQKLKALWEGSYLVYLGEQGFVVSLDGRPLYRGIFLDKASQMDIRHPVLHSDMDEENRVVLRFSPIHYPFGSLWDDGTSGDALDSPASLEVTEVQSAFKQAFPEVRKPTDHLSKEERELVARYKRRILDPRVRALFAGLGVPAKAPRHPKETLAGGPAPVQPLVTVEPWMIHEWELHFELGDPESVAEIRIRAGDDATWHAIYPDKDQTRLKVPPEWLTPGRHRFEVKLVDFAGVESAPYVYWFEPEQKRLLLAKDRLRGEVHRWAQFLCPVKYSKCNSPYLDFTTALEYRDGLREIRYSFGDCALDRRFPFEPWTDLAKLVTVDQWDDETAVPVEPEVTRACVQLVYLDGEESEPQVYDRLSASPPEDF